MRLERLKPRSEGVMVAVKTLGAKSFVMVGDLIHDATAVREAGVSSVIVERNPSMKLSFHAGYIVQSLDDVPTLVQALMKNSGCWNRVEP
jgi:phosphoglycolate phosphatase-like HAD superfamily hydrolase